MDYSSSQWSNKISGLLKKTENNLSRNFSQQSLNLGKTRFSESVYYSGRTEEDLLATSFDFQQFKKFVIENLKGNSLEIQKIHKKLCVKDQLDSEFFEYKEDLSLAIENVEKRCLSELRRLESNSQQFVTFDKLRISEEKLKSDNYEKSLQIELNFKDIKQTIFSLKDILIDELEEKIRSFEKKHLNSDDVRKLKENISNDVRLSLVSVAGQVEEFEVKLENFHKNFLEKIEKSKKKNFKLIETKNQNFNENLTNLNKKINQITEDFLQRFEKIDEIVAENFRDYQKLMKDQGKFQSLQDEISFLKEKQLKLPNFEDFSKKKELLELSQSFSESQQNFSLATKQELKKINDLKPNLYEYVKKTDLEEISNNLSKKIEVLKMASAGKAEIEKIKKSLQDFCIKEDMIKLQKISKDNEKSGEEVLKKISKLEAKLEELERRLEDDNQRKIEKWKNEQMKMKKEENKIEETVVVMNFESKEEKNQGFNFGNRGREPMNLSKKGKNLIDHNTEEFISTIFEEFINCEIDLGVKTLQRRSRGRAPAMIFSINSESSLDSQDDLNQAVILNTDLTNKSESPIDLNKF